MELAFWQVFVLAVVQGMTEFLPVSSSGHVVVVSALICEEGQNLDIGDINIVLHLGTLLSILVFYWHRVWRLLGQDRRTVGLLVVGTIPAVAVGLPLKMVGPDFLLESPLLAGMLLPVTGLVLLWVSKSMKGEKAYNDMSHSNAVKIGLAQATAILPGLSRSGMTISAGLRCGLTPESAATFSFLLAIPAIGGAGVLEVASLMRETTTVHTPISYLIAGGFIAFVVGLVSLRWLINWLESGRLQLFAWWCIPLGIAVVIWQLVAHGLPF
jgi:undecaprenyl-diphosphatase